ncbi:MAG: zonular occludens toxin domain-containing protein [Candidatus Pacearchaeota archaeon]
MAIKKKSPLLFRIIKYVISGILMIIWFILSGIIWVIWKIISLIFKSAKKAIKESAKEGSENKEISKTKKRRKGFIANKKAMFEPFVVLDKVSGDYALSERRLHNDSIIALIFGKRGSGKSALGFRLLENIANKTNRKCFVLGVDEESMPEWINSIEKIEDAPSGSVVLVDEGAISFSSRESMSKANKNLAGILAIARHKNLTVLFITQNTGMLDKNVLKLSDMLLVKQGSLLQLEMERPEIRKFYEKAESLFNKLKGDKRQYVYVIDSDFEGAISHSLPSFWTENLSKNQAK